MSYPLPSQCVAHWPPPGHADASAKVELALAEFSTDGKHVQPQPSFCQQVVNKLSTSPLEWQLMTIVTHIVWICLTFFKIVPVAGAKRGGLEVDVCVEDVRWFTSDVGWRGGVAQGELVMKLAQDWPKRRKKKDHSSRLCRPFLGFISGVFLHRLLNAKPFLKCYWAEG